MKVTRKGITFEVSNGPATGREATMTETLAELYAAASLGPRYTGYRGGVGQDIWAKREEDAWQDATLLFLPAQGLRSPISEANARLAVVLHNCGLATHGANVYAATDCACPDAVEGLALPKNGKQWQDEGRCICPCHVASAALALLAEALEASRG